MIIKYVKVYANGGAYQEQGENNSMQVVATRNVHLYGRPYITIV